MCIRDSMWLGVHLSFLTGTRNRLVAANEWTINAFSRTRHNLAVTEGQLERPVQEDDK